MTWPLADKAVAVNSSLTQKFFRMATRTKLYAKMTIYYAAYLRITGRRGIMKADFDTCNQQIIASYL